MSPYKENTACGNIIDVVSEEVTTFICLEDMVPDVKINKGTLWWNTK